MAGRPGPPRVTAMSREHGLSPAADWDDFRFHRQRWLDRLAADAERVRLEAAFRLPAYEAAGCVAGDSAGGSAPGSPSGGSMRPAGGGSGRGSSQRGALSLQSRPSRRA